MRCPRCGKPVPNMVDNHKCKPVNFNALADAVKAVTPEKQEGPRREEFPNEFGYKKYQEGRRAGRAERDAEVEVLKTELKDSQAFCSQQTQGTLALIADNGNLENKVKQLKHALNLTIPRCVKCLAYATKFQPKKMWPLCDEHGREEGATQVITYHNAIKAKETLDRT